MLCSPLLLLLLLLQGVVWLWVQGPLEQQPPQHSPLWQAI
jgi:hypothetical protein